MPKPTPAYPGSIAGDLQLAIAVNRFQTSLALQIGSTDTQMFVANTANIIPDMLLSLDVDGEIVQVTGAPTGNAVPISRGFDGTTPVLHLAGATVSGLVDAYHHNTLVAEIEAIEQTLGPNLVNVGASQILYNTSFIFAPQTPGGTLAAGAQVVTLTPVPKGVNGTDQNHYLYISGGTGTAEAAKIIGGTAVSGAASGTVIVQCANSHSGAWTIQTATAGLQEAAQQLPNGGVIQCPPGTYPINGLFTVFTPQLTINGQAATFQATAGLGIGVMFQIISAATGFRMEGVTLDGNQANGGMAGATSWVMSIAASNALVRGCEIKNAIGYGIFVGDNAVVPSNVTISNCYIHNNGGASHSGVGVYTGGTFPPTEIRVLNNRFEYNGTSSGVIQAGNAVCITSGGNGCLVDGNFCLNNYNNSGGQIYVDNGNNPNARAIVRGNLILRTAAFLSDQTYGIEIHGQNTLVDGNFIDGAQQYGIQLQASYTTAVNNSVTNTPVGVLVNLNPGAGNILISHILVANNTLNTSAQGVWTADVSDCVVMGNNLTGAVPPFAMIAGDQVYFRLNAPFVTVADPAPVTVANSTTLTTLKSFTVPAGYLFPGRGMRITAWGIYSSAGATGDHLTFTVNLGATGIMAWQTPDTGAANTPWQVTLAIICSAAGSAGSINYTASGFIPYQVVNSNANNGVFAVNTTVSNGISENVQWNAAKAGNTITVQGFTIEELP